MITQVFWKNGFVFEGIAGPHSVMMDAPPPLGRGNGANPKELLVMALAGSTAMDVIGLLKKSKQQIDNFEIESKIQSSEGEYPIVFMAIDLIYKLKGSVEHSELLKAVQLSQTKFCGISAMLSKSTVINWQIWLNEEHLSSGRSDFESTSNRLSQSSYDG